MNGPPIPLFADPFESDSATDWLCFAQRPGALCYIRSLIE
jgi:hypothetical protein